MIVLDGDIWRLSGPHDAIVIPVNIGWKSDGKNPMGKGLARQAARRWPWLPEQYGAFCQKHGQSTPLCVIHVKSKWCHTIILLPTKPLDEERPYLSWRGPAHPILVETGVINLQRHAMEYCLRADSPPFYYGRRILVPALGCGEGGMDPILLEKILNRHLAHTCFVYVKYTGEEK